MDINCVHHCLYQNDGKCTLSELPPQPTNAISQAVYTADTADCPYFFSK